MDFDEFWLQEEEAKERSAAARAAALSADSGPVITMAKRVKTEGSDVGTVMSDLRDQVDVILAAAKKEAKEMKEAATAEIAAWEAEKKDINKTRAFEPIIKLNVGGTYMSTTLKTLTSFPDSTLGKMFSGRHSLPKDENGAYFIDRCPGPFAEILAFLRSPVEYRAENSKVSLEAAFFGLVLTVNAVSIDGRTTVCIARGPDNLWYWSLGRGEQHPVVVCKACGFGCPKATPHLGVFNFTFGRTIDPAQPMMTAGTTCFRCEATQ